VWPRAGRSFEREVKIKIGKKAGNEEQYKQQKTKKEENNIK